jgi:hypothetical protein
MHFRFAVALILLYSENESSLIVVGGVDLFFHSGKEGQGLTIFHFDGRTMKN